MPKGTVSDINSDEFMYTVGYVKEGFSKLAAQSSNEENEVLYQSSRDYAETAVQVIPIVNFYIDLIVIYEYILFKVSFTLLIVSRMKKKTNCN